MDIIDDNAYELSREFPVTQDGLFDAFINEAILKSIWVYQASLLTQDRTARLAH